ncbi:hypothetical protein HG535_0H03870 [Zygotorulaspora mrakii]|uniref:WSC domain-containing protein n=1 Tax=Zygotorulaspora mrakii TaxID=42260 RepID=A0A7H9B9D0_ZYGMR|nr:uncharacterized protein HG535_0H03870 [Zygotorulaspora mrakii]QLG75060.1 hypothetical protein HG535_0H03870 [Zygotorulaspora mrakii]
MLIWILCLCLCQSVTVKATGELFCSSQNSGSSSGGFQNIYQSHLACSEHCNGSSYAILQNSNCWCSNQGPSGTVSVDQCNQFCPGFRYENCGSEENGLFEYIYIGAGSPDISPSLSSSSESSLQTSSEISQASGSQSSTSLAGSSSMSALSSSWSFASWSSSVSPTSSSSVVLSSSSQASSAVVTSSIIVLTSSDASQSDEVTSASSSFSVVTFSNSDSSSDIAPSVTSSATSTSSVVSSAIPSATSSVISTAMSSTTSSSTSSTIASTTSSASSSVVFSTSSSITSTTASSTTSGTTSSITSSSSPSLVTTSSTVTPSTIVSSTVVLTSPVYSVSSDAIITELSVVTLTSTEIPSMPIFNNGSQYATSYLQITRTILATSSGLTTSRPSGTGIPLDAVSSKKHSNGDRSSYWSSPGKVAGTFVPIGVFIVVLIIIIWVSMRRRRRYSQNFEKERASSSTSANNSQMFVYADEKGIVELDNSPVEHEPPTRSNSVLWTVDQRLDPRRMLSEIEHCSSKVSLADDVDYSRKVLRIVNE